MSASAKRAERLKPRQGFAAYGLSVGALSFWNQAR